MERLGDWYMHRGKIICKNYGGWVLADGNCYYIFKALSDAKNYIDKHDSGVYKSEPRIIGTMTDDQFINALK